MIKNIIRDIKSSALVRFLLVGCLGLASDISLLYALRHVLGLVFAKAVSYLIALTVTWILNRYFTFRSQDSHAIKEYGRYACIYLCTGVIHVSMFAYLVHRFIYFHQKIAL